MEKIGNTVSDFSHGKRGTMLQHPEVLSWDATECIAYGIGQCTAGPTAWVMWRKSGENGGKWGKD